MGEIYGKPLREQVVPDREVRCVFYEKAGVENTERTFQLARENAQELGIRHIVIASSSGETGARAAEFFQGLQVVVVTPPVCDNMVEMQPEYRRRIELAGAHILTCTYVLGGVSRAVRRKLGTYQLEEIIAFVLRDFSEGIKVACEITMMAADAGLVPVGEEIIAIAGTTKGADTAAVILSANAQDFFDLRVLEILCKPRVGGRYQSANT